MLKKLLANKKWLILIVAIVIVLVGVLIVVFMTLDSKENGKSNIGIETDKNKDSETLEDGDADEVYNGDGLEVEDTLDESVYTIDGSGDWDGTSDTSNKKEEDNKTDDAQLNDTQLDDTQLDDTKKEESNGEVNDTDGELEGDILVDDKVWGDPS